MCAPGVRSMTVLNILVKGNLNMKQLGNLAIVCARRPDVLMQIYDGTVTVHVGAGHERETLHSAWDNDEDIRRIVQKMNFGRYGAKAAN